MIFHISRPVNWNGYLAWCMVALCVEKKKGIEMSYQTKSYAWNIYAVRMPLLFLLSVLTAAGGAAERSPQANPGEGELTAHFRRMSTYHGRMDGSVPEGAVLFIGDSITQGLCVAAICEHGVNYGIGSDTTAGVLERLPLYTSTARAAAVVLAIGVNDLQRRDNEYILENLREILERVTKDVPVVISSILPLDERAAAGSAGRNERIAKLNEEIAALCILFPTCVYVNAFPLLLDDTKNLSVFYHVGDGVHPNTAGYEKWIDALRNGIETVTKSEKVQKR
ncbi:MAG: hypothetical protein KAH38_00325 [Candidatus Hydrogenedentes bacterium]|nr:hypothetical protein [Candidatus Hydrogenedentota bacterium]